jgi:hypothetical protein
MKPIHASIFVALPIIALLGYLISIWHDPSWTPSGGEVQGFIFLFIILSLYIVMIFSFFPLIKNQLLKKGKFYLALFIFSTFISAELITLVTLFLISLYFGPIADIYFYLITPLMVSIPIMLFAALWWLLVCKLTIFFKHKAS